tara:strand:- start:827 stop:1213 length:387 start_codon:yes stop_codon:yes gene_type:complete
MPDKSNAELVRELIVAFTQLKEKIEAERNDGGRQNLENSVKQLIQGQEQLQKTMSEMKKEILNPYNGVIVETIKNTEFRKKLEERGDLGIDLLTEHKELMKWKGVVTKAAWLILTTVAGIIAFLVTNG